jgi:glycosyltransferase involved in cell wall biosynthesis
MNLPLPLSVIIITLNEADQIEACLASVKRLAAEIIVVDADSTDNTVELARAQGAQVHQTSDWPGFGPQKNRALKLARQPWVLSLDADERLTPALEAEISATLATADKHGDTPTRMAYEIPRLTQFCGHWVKHSGWYPDYVLRLFQRNKARFSDDWVHERVILEQQAHGVIGRFQHPLQHYSYRTRQQLENKSHRYANAGTQALYRKGVRCSIFAPFIHAGWAWWRTFILYRGFLDGKAGWVIAASNACSTYLKYRGLRALNRTRTTAINIK